MIKGIYTPNLVPFRPDQSINEQELRRLTAWLIEKGVSGLYPNGSTGEFIRLSFEERLKVVEIMVSEARGRIPILAGAAEANIELVLKACARYADLGCVAVSLTGPYYFKVSQESIEYYFREIARRSPIDILLYNIPQFSNEISLPVVERLALDCPRIVGIKDSSRDFPRLVATLAKIKPQRPDFAIFSGTEEIILPSLMMGADGGTIATSGIVPEVIMKLYNEFQAGNFVEARRIQFKLIEFIETMFAGGNFPEGFRAAMSLRGFQMGQGRQILSPDEQVRLEKATAKLSCMLTECGFGTPCITSKATSLPAEDETRDHVEKIVRNVLRQLKS